jgi:hypothetical protein
MSDPCESMKTRKRVALFDRTTNTVARRHHFVPQTMIRAFERAPGSKSVFAWKRSTRSITSTAAVDLCWIERFYEFNVDKGKRAYEDVYGLWESCFPSWIAGLRAGCIPEGELREDIVDFCFDLHTRNPVWADAFRNIMLRNGEPRLAMEVRERGGSALAVGGDLASKFDSLYRPVILHSPAGAAPFVSSDVPVGVYGPAWPTAAHSEVLLTPEPLLDGPYVVEIPLAPDLCMRFEQSPEVPFPTLIHLNLLPSEVANVNARAARRAEEVVFGSTRDSLADAVAAANSCPAPDLSPLAP